MFLSMTLIQKCIKVVYSLANSNHLLMHETEIKSKVNAEVYQDAESGVKIVGGTMNIDLEVKGSAAIIRVKDGCWLNDLMPSPETASQMKSEINRLISEGKNDFIINLGNNHEVLGDSIGIIVMAYKLANSHGRTFKLCNLSHDIENELKRYRLWEIFDIYESLSRAMGAKFVRTYYDNLRIHRNSTDDEIDEAYEGLEYELESGWITSESEIKYLKGVIDKAHSILSDPIKRRDHDNWIAKEEDRTIADLDRKEVLPPHIDDVPAPAKTTPPSPTSYPKAKRLLKAALIVVAVGVASLWWARYRPLGSSGQIVYVYDRLAGEIVAVAGPNKIPVKGD